MKRKLLKILLLLLVLPVLLSSQEDKNIDYIKKLSEFRESHVTLEAINSIELNKLLSKWSKKDMQQFEFKEFIYTIIQHKKAEDLDSEVVSQKFTNWSPLLSFDDYITTNDVNVINQNSELIELILFDVIDVKSPYQLKPNKNLFKELAFYEIKQNDVVGEIGAGTGEFSLLLAILESDIKLTVNEISERSLKYIKKKLDANSKHIENDNIQLIKGDKSSANFTANSYDKIIVRNTFHHFTSRKKMIQSMHESLNEDGVLYISEPFKNKMNEVNSCTKIIRKDTAIKSIEAGGFKLLETKILDSWTMLKFQKIKK